MKPWIPVWLQGITLALFVSLSIGFLSSSLYSQASSAGVGQTLDPRLLTPTPTFTATPNPIFDVRVIVTLPKTTIQVGEIITAVVTIDNRSVGCQYPVYDLTLSQQGATIFRFDSPPVVGPPVYTQTIYTLTAITTGTGTLQATAYGERNCGTGWQWTYVNGSSPQLTVGAAGVYTVTTTADSGPGSLRQLIAEATPGATIRFAPALSGQTITLSTQLNVTKSLTIDGSTLAQPITLSGNNAVRVMVVDANIDVTVMGVVIANGKVEQPISPPITPTPPPLGGLSTGGGLVNDGRLTLNAVIFANNLAGPSTSAAAVAPPLPSGSSGALRNNGVVTITNSVFQDNRAINGDGGAIENYGQMVVYSSTFVNNYAFHLGGARGGAIYNAATLTINSSTFSNNTAEGAFVDPSGGAIYNAATLTVNNSTFAGNTGSSLAAGGPTHLYNSIVANSVNGVDCEGTLTTNLNNLIEDSSCGAAITGDPMLGPLANNGGSTQTHLPLVGSPAIDAGGSTTCPGIDQRGITRPQDGNGDGIAICDIGAVEVSAAESTLIFADGFESGNLNLWSPRTIDSGDLSVTRGAALAGRFGMSALLDDNNPIHVTDERPNSERGYQVRFRFDPNTIVMATGDLHTLFYGYVGTSTPVLRLEMRFAASQYQLRVALRNDATTWTNSAWFTISDTPHLVQLNWRAATAAGANNGRLAFRIDAVLKSTLTGVDNDTRRIDRARLGAVAGIDSGTRGSYFFDAFQANRTVITVGVAQADEEPAEDSTAFLEEVTAEELAAEAVEAPASQHFLPLVTR